MIIVSHRVNRADLIDGLPEACGVEFDVRDYNGSLVVAHDPYDSGESFDKYIDKVGSRFLIVNVKCEGIESEILSKLKHRGISRYFLLDSTIPAISKLVRNGIRSFACRHSVYEPLAQVIKFSEYCDWVWLDYLNEYLPSRDDLLKLRALGLKLCAVSPELLGASEIVVRKVWAYYKDIGPEMICTKMPVEAEKFFSCNMR